MKSALDYHTAVSYDRFDMRGGSMDWSNQPSVFKDYPDAPLIVAPAGDSPRSVPIGDVFEGPRATAGDSLDAVGLAAALALGYGLTARAAYGSGFLYYRSAPSAGALYPVEIYVNVEDMPGLDDGLYHYSVSRAGLKQLRQGSYNGHIARDILDDPKVSPGRATFFLTALYFRSSWKYRDRAYRYHLLDTGHALENLVLALQFVGHAPRIALDFDDAATAAFLGLDETMETPLAMAYFEGKGPIEQGSDSKPRPISLKTSQLAPRIERFAPIEEVNRLCARVSSPSESRIPEPSFLRNSVSRWVKLEGESDDEALGRRDFAEVVMNRRSKRNFVKRELKQAQLAELARALRKPHNDNRVAGFGSSFTVGALLGNVEGLEDGFYLVEPEETSVGFIKSGNFQTAMAQVCLDQMWLMNSNALFVFLADLQDLENRFGPRGYRYAMIEAGSLGQRLYLAAGGLDLGCCGIGAFYDNEAMDLLDLSGGQRMFYLVAVGTIKK